MIETNWEVKFREVYGRARSAFENGASSPAAIVSAEDRGFLESIGCSDQELFDLVEDDVAWGEPGLEKAVRITEVRYRFFLEEQGGRRSGKRLGSGEIPGRKDELGGIPWLPRIIAKARAKLRGELPPELMYSCGGDREFLSTHGLEADAFLKKVWEAGDDKASILEYVRQRGQG